MPIFKPIIVPLVGVVLISAGIGCAPGVDPEAARCWRAEYLPPVPLDGTARSIDADTEKGYYLYLCTDAVGVDFSTWQSFSSTLQSPPGQSKFDPSSGHSWIALEKPEQLLFRGHTGNEGVIGPTYSQMFMRLNASGHPNPIVAIKTPLNDGRSHDRLGRHKATFALRVPITMAEYERLRLYVDLFDYRMFALVDHQCTDFVAGAARAIGLNPAYRVRIDLPPKARMWGRDIRFWSDPEHKTITLGSPDLLQSSLQELEMAGYGEDSTASIGRRANEAILLR